MEADKSLVALEVHTHQVRSFFFDPVEDGLDPGLMGSGGTQAGWSSSIPHPTLAHVDSDTLTSLAVTQGGQLPLVTSHF